MRVRARAGDCKSESFITFWTAVKRFAPTAELSADLTRPTSARTSRELQPAYDLVAYLLRVRHPEAWDAFCANGSANDCAAIPELQPAVEAYLASADDAPPAPSSVGACIRNIWCPCGGQELRRRVCGIVGEGRVQ